MRNTRHASTLQILFLAATWGGSYALIKVGLRDLSPGSVTFLRLVLGSLFLLPIALRSGALAGVRERLGWVAVVAVIQILIPVSLIATGEQWIPSSLAGVLNGSVPIFMALLAPLLVREETPGARQIAGIALGFVGVVAVYGIDIGGGFYGTLGALCMTGSSIGYALGPLLARRRLSELAPIGLVTSMLGVAAVLTAPVLLIDGPSEMPGWKALAAVVVLGALGTGTAFAVYYRVQAVVGPTRTSVVAYLIPGFALVYGLPLGESIGPGAIVGLVCIVGGSVLLARK